MEIFGNTSCAKAQKIWNKLHPKVEANPAMEAIADLIQNPDDPDLQAVFRVQLKKILEQDDELCQAIAQIFESNDGSPPLIQINQTVTGNQNQTIGQVTVGSVIMNLPPQPEPSVLNSSEKENSPVKTILVLAANPKDTNPLRLGEEVSSIQKGLERSKDRDRFRLEQRWAVTAADVRRALLDCQPQIVHFSGHGMGVATTDAPNLSARDIAAKQDSKKQPEGLVFEDNSGQPHLVSNEAISTLFSLFADKIESVVLNACYSATQANAIAKHIPYVVGMKKAIGDRAAIEFSIGFYDALVAGRDVYFAFQLGCSSLQMEGIPEHLTPSLRQKTKQV